MPENIENQPNDAPMTVEQFMNIKEEQRKVGAKVLSMVGFENREKEIVKSSFNKARESGEKLPGKNNERRNYAYLSRLDRLIDRYGNRLEQKLWDASADKLIIDPENITDSYWKTQEQILRDNGQGRELGDYEKSILTENIQKQQRESLESWSNYLGSEQSPYPTWFKIYAWDGMSKMGVFDKEKGYFAKRDEHTVAPYPKLNPAVLAKTYSAVSDFYGFEPKDRYAEDETRSEALEGLVKSGNFNKLYSKILLGEKAIPKTPERTEDVHGEWIEYLPGDEEKLASAAEGTPWCVADPGTGRNYLEYGEYAAQEDEYDDYDEYYEEDEYDDYYGDEYYEEDNGETGDENREETNQKNQSGAKFILFHLYDPEKNTLSESACASIRLDPDGRVAEISGLNEGQALEDSLVPIVEEKVKTLPGGEDFLEAFADKQELIRLDHKMQNGEDLTIEELEFVYEINRPIKTLDTYNARDIRIDQLVEKYDLEYALAAGLNADQCASKLEPDGIAKNLDILCSHGADVNQLASGMMISRYGISTGNLNTLLSHGADVNQLTSEMYSSNIIENLDTLLSHGADANQLVSRMDTSAAILNHLDALTDHGANIDIDQLASHLNSRSIVKYLDTLCAHGADVNQLVSSMHIDDVLKNFDTLLSYGADVNQLASVMVQHGIIEHLNALTDHGANINISQLVSNMWPSSIAKNLDTLLSYGADANQLMSRMKSPDIAENFDALLSHGADANQLASRMSYSDIAEHLDALIDHGANIDINELPSGMNYSGIAKHLDTLLSHGANIDMNQLASHLTSYGIVIHLSTLLSHGADVNYLASRMKYSDIVEHLDTLRAYGYQR